MFLKDNISMIDKSISDIIEPISEQRNNIHGLKQTQKP
jgi:hypothetical protein